MKIRANKYCGLRLHALSMLVLLTANSTLAQQESTASSSLPSSTLRFPARDTLDIGIDAKEDANDCLSGLSWPPAAFEVEVHGEMQVQENMQRPGWLALQFPSPRPIGNPRVDRVHVEWHAAREADSGQVLRRPGMIIVHESGSGMHVGRLIASELGRRGIHGFMVQLPGYGERKDANWNADDLLKVFNQGVADVRRARDAIAVLPQVDPGHIGLQGTSLGGFVATLAGGLDCKFDSVYLLLCGGDLHGVLTQGGQDARKARQRLLASGVRAEDLQAALWPVEPLRLAHRLRPESTWLYCGIFDDVVPPQFSNRLAESIPLQPNHYVKMLASHYSGIIFLPGVIEHMKNTALEVQSP